VTYQCQDFTITSSISECDQKCETRNAESEIVIDGWSKSQQNPCGTCMGPGLAPIKSSGHGDGRVRNRIDPFLWSKSTPLPGYPDPLQTVKLSCQTLCQKEPGRRHLMICLHQLLEHQPIVISLFLSHINASP